MLDAITLFLFNIVVYNIPLLYGTAGEIMIEKSGSLNLGVEGTMAIGAVAGYVAACRTDSLAIGDCDYNAILTFLLLSTK